MKLHHYTFVTTWHFQAPLVNVWVHLADVELWPSWWKGVKHTKILEHQGKHGGVGTVIATTWKSWLPYTISFVLTILESNPKTLRIVAKAEGDLSGTGTWEFSHTNGITTAVYTWSVSTTKPWMNFIAPFARPVFAHAHDVVMQWGEDGLKKLLESER
jgi:hypothetical protein